MKHSILVSGVVAAVLVVVAGAAHADSQEVEQAAQPRAPLGVHVGGGVEAMVGDQVTTTAMRGAIGIDVPLWGGRVQPTLGVGVTIAGGQLGVEDPRALSGTLSIGYFEVGPEVRVGLRFVNGGFVDKQLFASLAYLRTTLDDRLMLDAVAGVGGTRGTRASVGFNYSEALLHVAGDVDKGSELNWLLVLVPGQVEVTYEQSCGSDRLGVALSWGI